MVSRLQGNRASNGKSRVSGYELKTVRTIAATVKVKSQHEASGNEVRG